MDKADPPTPPSRDATASRVRFEPHEYRDLSTAEQDLLRAGYENAIRVIHKNITPLGFSACSLEDNEATGTDSNYRSVWARDGALCVIWTLDLDDEAIRHCQRQTLQTLLQHQTPTGQIPANVRIETGEPDYSGVGGIAAIDSVLWAVIACSRSTTSLRGGSPKRCAKRRWRRRYSSTGACRLILETDTTSPCSASKTGKRPVSFASRAIRMVSFDAAPQPSGQGTNRCR